MKSKIIVCKLLLLGFIAVSIHSCSDDFVTKRREVQYIDETSIYMYPDEDAKEYPIIWAVAGNATFAIIKKPDWLKVESMTGQFINGKAVLTLSAVRNELFTAARFYVALVTIEVDGVGKGVFPVSYISIGSPDNPINPDFFCDDVKLIDFGSTITQYILHITNRAPAILIWKLQECPQWITMDIQNDIVIGGGSPTIKITCNRAGLPKGIHEGVIVLSTNDKDQPTYTITVRCQVGD